ncbi:MAG: hypothetical protein ACREXV_02255 [Polaromonas sp.]
MPGFFRWIALGLALASAPLSTVAVTTLGPARDDEVIEVLPAITRSRPARVASAPGPVDPAAAAVQARQAITVARQMGDTRYWGRAQAVLAPWWDQPDAPAELAILQATVQQGRHEFEASRKVLTAALARAPGNAQGWLNLAALERLSARYAESLLACDAVARAGQALYAAACRLETQSLQGQHQSATQDLQALIERSPDRGQRSWLLSLLAESQERWGRDRAAAQAYTSSLALEPDLYTAIAYSDLLLRGGKASQALQALAALPETDAVLLRRAAAWRRLGDARWTGARAQLQEREAELQRRGDDVALHGRELALTALWLDDDAPRALELARRNLLLQREPLDWWVAMQSARRAKNTHAQAEIASAIRAAGLHDARLAATLPHAPSANVKGAK